MIMLFTALHESGIDPKATCMPFPNDASSGYN
jgi:hypothetical protein